VATATIIQLRVFMGSSVPLRTTNPVPFNDRRHLRVDYRLSKGPRLSGGNSKTHPFVVEGPRSGFAVHGVALSYAVPALRHAERSASDHSWTGLLPW
jgi:hypothetical protein